jgi:hypothetical protein
MRHTRRARYLTSQTTHLVLIAPLLCLPYSKSWNRSLPEPRPRTHHTRPTILIADPSTIGVLSLMCRNILQGVSRTRHLRRVAYEQKRCASRPGVQCRALQQKAHMFTICGVLHAIEPRVAGWPGACICSKMATCVWHLYGSAVKRCMSVLCGACFAMCSWLPGRSRLGRT